MTAEVNIAFESWWQNAEHEVTDSVVTKHLARAAWEAAAAKYAITYFFGDEVPQFSAGVVIHDLTEIVTPTHCAGWITRIAELERKLAAAMEADEFWPATFDGAQQMTPEQVKAELFDYHFMMQQVGKIYMELTGGILSKQNYYSDTVLGAMQGHVQKMIDEGVAERLKDNDG